MRANIRHTGIPFVEKSVARPYTFILEATKEVPKLLKTKKDTVGIRVPDHIICQTIVQELGHPLISAFAAHGR